MKEELKSELVVIEQSTAMEMFKTPNGLDPVLEKIKQVAKAFVADVQTPAGRKDIKVMAKKINKASKYVDSVGKGIVDDLKRIPKLIDSERKRSKDLLAGLKAQIEAPLIKWDNDEKLRVSFLQDKIKSIVDIKDSYNEQLNSFQIKELALKLDKVIIDASWAEYEEDAVNLKLTTMASLRNSWTRRSNYEADQARLKKLEEEAAKREKEDNDKKIAEAAAEKAKKDADENSKRELEASKQREKNLEFEKKKLEQDKIDAKKRSDERMQFAKEKADREQADAVEKERLRLEAIDNRKKAEDKKRQDDINHRASIESSTLKILIANGIDFSTGTRIIALASKGKLGHLFIRY